MDSLIFSLNAVLPIICIVLLGYFLRRFNLIKDNFIKSLSRFNFRYAFMAMIFMNIYSIETLYDEYLQLAVYTFCAILILIAFGFAIAAFVIKDKKQKGVVAQVCFRSNFAIIGVPLAQSLFGDEGSACAAVMIAVSIPLFNIFAVIALSIFVEEHDKSQTYGQQVKAIAKKILTNPLIDGIIAGSVCLALRFKFPAYSIKSGSFSFIYKAIDSLGKTASPIGLICLGAQFKFSSVKRLLPQISLCVFIRLLLAPAAGLYFAKCFFPNFQGAQYAALLSLFGTPGSIASAIMAEQMNNDGELAGQVLVWTTIISAFTLFAFIYFFRSTGIF